ncbi:uncharacterized protein FPRO_02259 [Fusarium proliferatum ET1]|uniref:Uncharacterized protein n=1 Tax=Fusarium proliferatum (strain ET1) TaxID=1227346 RepID=A0A1L7V9M7_FUSPR|nr:uncharacterized protein FPRO_02259 [Fusarium proliferatum ET1]CZR37481.1 uncharacterized protein FPRO_02259 [Fusarium proliferatum ET1]
MFLIELDGYTIERFVHGLDAHYNDIPKWQYAKLSEVLSPTGQETQVKTWNISSRKEIDAFLKTEAFALGKGLQFFDIHMPKLDALQALIDCGKGAGARVG